MSVTSYMAGAAVEANIQEAIRLEEELAHGREMQQLINRFQSRLDEKNANIEHLQAVIEDARQLIERHERYNQQLRKVSEHNQRCAEYWQRKFVEQHIHDRIERAKVDAMVEMRLPAIVQIAVESVAAGVEREQAIGKACTAVRVRVSSSRLRNERMTQVVNAELARLERSGVSLDTLANQPETVDMTQIAELYREGEVEGPRATVADIIQKFAVTSA